MADTEQGPKKIRVVTDPSVTLFLSLYLLLLAFFILLNTISTYEKVKTQQVQQSLSSAFASILPPTTSLQTVTAVDGPSLAAEQTQQKLGDLFKSAIKLVRVQVIQPGKLMEVMMHVDQLFEPNSILVREREGKFLDQLASVLKSRKNGTSYEVEVMMGSDVGAKGTVPVENSLEIGRAGAFARALIEHGAPQDSLFVGIDPAADPLIVTFRFFWKQDAPVNVPSVGPGAVRPGTPPGGTGDQPAGQGVPIPLLPKQNGGG
jgi:hypothetical protein